MSDCLGHNKNITMDATQLIKTSIQAIGSMDAIRSLGERERSALMRALDNIGTATVLLRMEVEDNASRRVAKERKFFQHQAASLRRKCLSEITKRIHTEENNQALFREDTRLKQLLTSNSKTTTSDVVVELGRSDIAKAEAAAPEEKNDADADQEAFRIDADFSDSSFEEVDAFVPFDINEVDSISDSDESSDEETS